MFGRQAEVSYIGSPSTHKHPTIPCTVSSPIWRRYVLFPDMLLSAHVTISQLTWAPG